MDYLILIVVIEVVMLVVSYFLPEEIWYKLLDDGVIWI